MLGRPGRSEGGGAYGIEAVCVGKGIVVAFVQFETLGRWSVVADSRIDIGAYGAPELAIIPSRDDRALRVGTQSSLD